MVKEMKNIKFELEHWGSCKTNAEDFGYKSIIITGPIVGKKDPQFGRLVQVRKKSGFGGSDTVVIRLSDGTLQSYHNMMFFSVAKEFFSLYEEAMKEVDEKGADKEGDEYDIEGENPATGFIVTGLNDLV